VSELSKDGFRISTEERSVKSRFHFLLVIPLVILAGCAANAPQVSTIDGAQPFNQAMEAVIVKDEFLTENLRPGFYRSADGAVEGYTINPAEEGGATIEHLAMLSRNWCTQNGGKVSTFPEVPVLLRGVGYVVQQKENLPVTGKVYNMICFRGRTPLAAAAIGRNTFFLNAADYRRAWQEAGASIVNLSPGP
jgi:hypothetical protein